MLDDRLIFCHDVPRVEMTSIMVIECHKGNDSVAAAEAEEIALMAFEAGLRGRSLPNDCAKRSRNLQHAVVAELSPYPALTSWGIGLRSCPIVQYRISGNRQSSDSFFQSDKFTFFLLGY